MNNHTDRLEVEAVYRATDGPVTVQTCGDLGTIRPLVEGQPSTEFPLQTVSVPSNVNSYMALTGLTMTIG